MRKITLIAAAFAFASAAHAQGTFPLNNVPIGKGPGKTGFTAVAPGADGTCLVVSGGVPTFGSCLSGLTGQVLSRTNDTNVTLTLGGSPNTALVNAASLTLGWTGTLAISRGGTGAGTQQAFTNAALNCPPTRAGDLAYYNGTNWVCLAGNNTGTRVLQEDASGVPSWVAAGTGTVTSVTLGSGYGISVTGTNPVTGSGTFTPAVGLSTLTNALAANVNVTNATYVDGPSVAQGTTGTWLAVGTVTLLTAATSIPYCRLTDGTTVVAASGYNSSQISRFPIALSGVFTSPAGNIRIQCSENNAAAYTIQANVTSNGNVDSRVTVIRIQ